ncbi:MAG: hypothetical protein JW820_19165 [Spirochaetales bacterium]|nr:hypothetical protein [Spirochaetales bacterium]
MTADCTTFELEASPQKVAIPGIGSCGQHSAHLTGRATAGIRKPFSKSGGTR